MKKENFTEKGNNQIASIDRVLVGLELREADLHLIKYVEEFVSRVRVKRVDFIHISESFQHPHPDIGEFSPKDEELEQKMKDEVSLCFSDTNCEMNFEVIEGKPVEKLLRWATIKQSDLIVLGRKQVKKYADITLEKIVRKAPCSVLIVPDQSPIGFEKILFPIDYSSKTIDGITMLDQVFDMPTIDAIHFFDLPSGYSKTGKTKQEFIQLMDKNAKDKVDKLISGLATTDNLSFKNICSTEIDEFDYIIDYAKKNQHHIIAVGSRGRTDVAAFLLGSFAEKFIRYNRSIPTFVFKEKGENMDFLKAFLKL